VGALAPDRQIATMAQTPVAAKVHQTLDIHRHFAPQITLNLVVSIYGLADLQNFGVGKLIDTPFQWNANLVADLVGKPVADAVNVLQRDDDALIRRNVNASYTSQGFLLNVVVANGPEATVGRVSIGR